MTLTGYAKVTTGAIALCQICLLTLSYADNRPAVSDVPTVSEERKVRSNTVKTLEAPGTPGTPDAKAKQSEKGSRRNPAPRLKKIRPSNKIQADQMVPFPANI